MTTPNVSPRYVVGQKDLHDDCYFAEPELNRTREQVLEAVADYLDSQEKEPDTAEARTEFTIWAMVDETSDKELL